jgi:hypothetical protein
MSQNLVRPLHEALPISDNSPVGTWTLSLDRQLRISMTTDSAGVLYLCR